MAEVFKTEFVFFILFSALLSPCIPFIYFYFLLFFIVFYHVVPHIVARMKHSFRSGNCSDSSLLELLELRFLECNLTSMDGKKPRTAKHEKRKEKKSKLFYHLGCKTTLYPDRAITPDSWSKNQQVHSPRKRFDDRREKKWTKI